MLVPTLLRCPELWGNDGSDRGALRIEVPPMYEGDRIHFRFTISWYGEIDGVFEVIKIAHSYDARKGYMQHLDVAPVPAGNDEGDDTSGV